MMKHYFQPSWLHVLLALERTVMLLCNLYANPVLDFCVQLVGGEGLVPAVHEARLWCHLLCDAVWQGVQHQSGLQKHRNKTRHSCWQPFQVCASTKGFNKQHLEVLCLLEPDPSVQVIGAEVQQLQTRPLVGSVSRKICAWPRLRLPQGPPLRFFCQSGGWHSG